MGKSLLGVPFSFFNFLAALNVQAKCHLGIAPDSLCFMFEV